MILAVLKDGRMLTGFKRAPFKESPALIVGEFGGLVSRFAQRNSAERVPVHQSVELAFPFGASRLARGLAVGMTKKRGFFLFRSWFEYWETA
jgi:hypothetical protein